MQPSKGKKEVGFLLLFGISIAKTRRLLICTRDIRRFYKKNVLVQLKNGTRKKAMIYLLPYQPLREGHLVVMLELILQGYKDMGFDTDYLYDSLDYNLKEVK